MKVIIFLLTTLFLTFGCKQKEVKLPFLGNTEVRGDEIIYPKIKDFSFINQDSTVVTNKTFDGKIYIADFIFLSCPTICPIMHVQLKTVYNKFYDNPNVLFLSHTIDPERDTVKELKSFTDLQDIDKGWHFVTGNRDSIMKIATESYFTTAYPDSNEPGGFVHSGGFLLIDKNRHVRGVYDGTDSNETKRLIGDIDILLNE